jgi:energy-coupling factor transporter ATP-binding protein EcfA2
MALSEPQAPDLRAALEAVVRPLFARLKPKPSADSSVPEIVLRHRQRRAKGRIVDALVSRGTASVPADLRKEVEALLRRWAAAGFSDGFEAAETFEIHCAREHDRVVAEESGDRERLLEVLEEEDRRRVIEQFGRIELRGIQTSHRILESLDEVYVPLHLEESPEETEREEGKIVVAISPQPRKEISEVLREHRQILVVGAPGSGKSTLLSYLATQAAAGKLLLGSESPLPLVVIVRSLKNPALTVKNLAEHTSCEPDLIERSLRQKNALLLIDGFDEAPPALREGLLNSLQRFLRDHPEIRVVLTSRPTGAPGEVEKRIEGLRPFRLVDLTRDEVSRFIEKWCLAAEKSVLPDVRAAEREAAKASQDLKRRLSTSFSVQRIAVNPLLVTILCVVHRFLGRTIPEHRVTLYEKCTDALLYEWDRAKFDEDAALSLLDAPAKRQLLMRVARYVHEAHAAEISEKEVIRHFAETLPDLDRPASDAKVIVEEIRDRSGLLVERRPGFFAFSHLTFQEYLCALDFVRTRSFDGLVEHFAEPWWQEVIVLAAGAPGGGGGTISRRLLAKKTTAAVFLAAQCLETEIDMPVSLRHKIEGSVRKLVPPPGNSERRQLRKLGPLAAPILAKSLATASSGDRAEILSLLEFIDYDPAIPAIAQCVPDRELSNTFFSNGWNASVGAYAVWILARKAEDSAIAKAALREAALKLPRKEIRHLLENLPEFISSSGEIRSILKKALRTAPPDTPAPKTASGTA